MQKNKVLSKIVSFTLAFAMLTTSLVTTELVANASESQNDTEYRSTLESITGKQSVDNVDSIEKLDTTDTIKNVDSDFKSCRLIITNNEDMEFEDEDNTIKSVQHIDNIYIVEYYSYEATEQAYNEYLSNGYDVELDTVKDAPEGISNKDKLDNDVQKEEIATTNEKKDAEKVDKINKDKDIKEIKDKKDIITVAILDTGLNAGEDIFTDRLVEGKNFIDENSDKTDDVDGHGTTMARVVLDTVDDVNQDDNIKIMPIKILNDKGTGTTLSAYKGIKYIIEEKQKNPDFNVVINISATGIGDSKLLHSAINEAYNNKIPVVVSAGNDNKDIKDYTPANVKSAFTISSAYQENGEYYKAPYSNYGKGIDYATSGDYEYIRNINHNEVITKANGSSVSSAYVTGYIALLKQMAISDEDDENNELSITTINKSLYLSAIDLNDNEYFGYGYLTKDNIVLDSKIYDDKSLEVENVDGIEEDIELEKNVSHVGSRTVHVYGLPPAGGWWVQVMIHEDNEEGTPLTWTDWVTKDDPEHGVGIPERWWKEEGEWVQSDGGSITVRKVSDTQVDVIYNDCRISTCTPWIRVGVMDGWNYKITGHSRPTPDPYFNSAQNQTRQYHWQDDIEWNNYVEYYGGIGAWDYGDGVASFNDIQFYWADTLLHVAYHGHGGNVYSLGQDHGEVYDVDYFANGQNAILGSLGRGVIPKRNGYTFKGWYFSERNDSSWEMSPKHWLTDLVDYANRNNAPGDLYDQFAAYDYNVKDLSQHLWVNGAYEPSRKQIDGNLIAERPSSWLDEINVHNNYDNYRMLLKDGKGICNLDQLYMYGLFGWGFYSTLEGQNIVAHAVWEKEPDITVTYDINGGKWTDGKTNDLTITYDATGYNDFFGMIGIDSAASPTKEEKDKNGNIKKYILKGWYFVDENSASDNKNKTGVDLLNGMIDYVNKYPDLKQAYTTNAFTPYYWYNIEGLWRHYNDIGTVTDNPKRSYNTSPHTMAENEILGTNYDNYNLLLPKGMRLGNLSVQDSYQLSRTCNNYRAIAIWEEAPGFKVTYDTNGGVFTDGTTEKEFGYNQDGTNTSTGEVGIGIHDTPTKEVTTNGKTKRYTFKGWFITDDKTGGTSITSKQSFGHMTNMIDYINRYQDLQIYNPQGCTDDDRFITSEGKLNLPRAWNHWNSNGKGEGRSYATGPKTISQNDMGHLNYDDYNMLLKGNQFALVYKEGIYDIPKDTELRAIAIWEEDDGKYSITYNMGPFTNDSRNPNSYTKDDKVTIYRPKDVTMGNVTYTFTGWRCSKTPPGNVDSTKTISYSWDKKEYGDLVFTAVYTTDIPPSSFEYYIVWDNNGNWQDGRDDSRLKNYNHSYNYDYYNYWHWSAWGGSGEDAWSDSDSGSTSWDKDYPSSISRAETPDTPRTATLYFDDPNAHGNTSNISSAIKTKKRFDYWEQIKQRNLPVDKSGDYYYSNSGSGWSSTEYKHHYAGSTRYYNYSSSWGEGYRSSDTTRINETAINSYRMGTLPLTLNEQFRDLYNCCTETTLRAHWTRLPETLPSVSKEGYDFLGWQINGTGRIYRAGEQYTVGEDDNDVTFVAVWRRNQGKVQYNPNGATYDNNQPYSKQSDNQNTMLINGYTTKSGNIFGNEAQKNEYVTRDPQKSNDPAKYIYYKTDKGTITNRMGTENELASFQGWSAITYARYDTPSILYNGYFKPFMNMYYDVTAVNKLNIINPPKTLNSNTVKARESQIVQHRNNNISKWKSTPRLSEIGDWFERLTTAKLYYDPSLEGNGIINVYATWDYYPQFNNCPDSVSVTSDFITHLNTSNAEQQILNRIIEKDKVTITDVEDGNLKPKKNAQTKEIEMNEYVHIVNFNLAELQELAKNKTGSTTVTIQVHDNAGNVTEKFVTLWINQSVSAESYSSGNVIDGYTRFVNKDSYNAPFEKGGLLDNSDWKLNPEYKQLILNAFDRIDSNTPIETWEFTKDDAKDAQEFVKNNGLGNSLSPNGLADYLYLINDKK